MKKLLVFFAFTSMLFSGVVDVAAQTMQGSDPKVALHRGFRTGYSDGYMAGYRDVLDNAAREFARHVDYEKANRAFNKEYGTIDDYRDGYRQGFEAGYAAGFEKRSFEAAVPSSLGRRGLQNTVAAKTAPHSELPYSESPVTQAPAQTIEAQTQPTAVPAAAQEPVDRNYSNGTYATDPAVRTPVTPGSFVKTTFTPVSDAIIIIPKDTELILELQDGMTTETARPGDRFIAKIISPTEISGAIIEGHVARVIKPGHIKRRSELQLSFNRIILTETRWSNFDALLTEVLPAKGDNIKRVDNEGAAQGIRPYKDDAIKIGAATGTGLTIGAIAGGPVGAAVGAGVGAAFGVGAVVIDRGKHVNLRPNQQLRVRTSFETQIR
ncbi:MAG TPA: hypothetical protein PKD26_16815 [Pyrinomonadaceae bacterium]|nr:hypothetical protein [Pyrinomonadaceae bacterium]